MKIHNASKIQLINVDDVLGDYSWSEYIPFISKIWVVLRLRHTRVIHALTIHQPFTVIYGMQQCIITTRKTAAMATRYSLSSVTSVRVYIHSIPSGGPENTVFGAKAKREMLIDLIPCDNADPSLPLQNIS